MHCHDFRRATDWRHFDFKFGLQLVSNVGDVGSTHDPAPSTVKMKDMRDQHVIFGISTKKPLNKMTTTTNSEQTMGKAQRNEHMLHARSNVLWYQTSYSTYISLCEKVAHKRLAKEVHIVEPMPAERQRRTCCHRTDQQPATGSLLLLLSPCPYPLSESTPCSSSEFCFQPYALCYAGATFFYLERTLQPWMSASQSDSLTICLRQLPYHHHNDCVVARCRCLRRWHLQISKVLSLK